MVYDIDTLVLPVFPRFLLCLIPAFMAHCYLILYFMSTTSTTLPYS